MTKRKQAKYITPNDEGRQLRANGKWLTIKRVSLNFRGVLILLAHPRDQLQHTIKHIYFTGTDLEKRVPIRSRKTHQ